ncbi:MAG: HAD family hydrolase [Myxococcaceae bacterium]|nr:HAD family hydrolase [Myxococcaceae bacterium]
MTARRERAPDVFLPRPERWVVEFARDLYLERKRRPVATQLPRPQLQEQLAILAARHLPLGVEEALGHVSRTWEGLVGGGRLPAPAPGAEAVPFATLRERVLARAAAHDVVGFDVFNTLVVRSVEGEWLKTAVARGLHCRLKECLHPLRMPTPAAVRQRRSELEVEIASERMARGEDDEVDFEELLARWVRSWVPREPYCAPLIAEVRELELELERLALRPAPGITDVLEGLKALGKRLIFVSDMYLSAPVLRELLRHCGLEGYFDAGYVSTDHGLRKASGRLFPRVLALEGLRPEQLLFIGDDENSDHLQPARLGISTLRVEDSAERQRRRRLEAAQQAAERNPFWAAHYVQEVLRNESVHVREDGDGSYQVGRLVAPGLVAFVIDLIERTEKLGIEHVYFLAREGLTLLKIFSSLRRSGVFRRLPKAHYLFVSRASTLLASMPELSWEELQRFWRQYSRQSLRSLLDNLSLPAEVFLPLAAECGLTDPNRPLAPPESDEAFRRFLESREVRSAFTQERDRARAELERYLRYRGLMGAQRVGLVDIGWKGSMQDNLARAFEGRRDFPELHGFYLAFTPGWERPLARSFKYGYLADLRREDREEADFVRNTAIFEMVTTANHGTTVRYGANPWAPSIPLPELVHHGKEKENSARFFRQAQQGIFDYARDFARLYRLLPFSAEELRPGVLQELLRYIRYPTREEADSFLQYSHVESFGVHEITTFGLKVDLRKLTSQRSPRGVLRVLWHAFRDTPWRDGVVRRSGIPLANLAYDAWFTWRAVR